jgi:hypothetical protein
MPSWIRTRRLIGWLFGALVFAGCIADTSNSGDLTIELRLINGTEIDEVSYSITGNDIVPIVGTIHTDAPGSTASVEVFGIPAGEDYTVMMTATSTDGETFCSGSAEFDVEVGISTPIMVMLNCKPNRQYGGVRVNGKFNFCTDIIGGSVAPLQTSIGNQIDVRVVANDEEGDDIEYLWTGTGGVFADPTAPETTYTCLEVGDQTITITVSDDGFEYCDCNETIDITCVEDGGTGGTGGSGGGGGMGGGQGGMGGQGGQGGMGGIGGSGGMGGQGGMGGMGGQGGMGGFAGMGGQGGMGGFAGMGGQGGMGGFAGMGGQGGMGGSGGVGVCIPGNGAQDAGPANRACPGSTRDCVELEVCVDGTCEEAAMVFVSGELFSADLGGPRGADKICAELAGPDGAGLGGYWMSWTSNLCTWPEARFHKSTIEYRLVNGDQIAANWSDLTDGELDRDIRIDENGVNLTTNCTSSGDFCWVWTNTRVAGHTDLNNGCLGLTWDANSVMAPALSGQWNRPQFGWTQKLHKDCANDLGAIYCFEQPESNQ